MPHLPTDRAASRPYMPSLLFPYTDSNAPSPKLPYSSHPLYNLRKCTIIVDLVGLVLICLAIVADVWNSGSMTGWAIGLLAASAILCFWDLRSYASKRAANPGEEPIWPSRPIMLADLLLGVALPFGFFVAASDIFAFQYRYRNVNLFLTYGILANLLAG